MNRRHNIYRLTLLISFTVIFIVLNIVVVGGMIYKQRKLEQGFQQMYGDDWKEQYDKRYGPDSLDRAHTRTVAGYAGIPIITILLWLIYKQATVDRSGGGGRPRPPKRFRQRNQW